MPWAAALLALLMMTHCMQLSVAALAASNASRLQVVSTANITSSSGAVSAFASDGADRVYWVDYSSGAPSSTLRVMDLARGVELPSVGIGADTLLVTADWVGHVYVYAFKRGSIVQAWANGTWIREVAVQEMYNVNAFAVSLDGSLLLATTGGAVLLVRVNDSALLRSIPFSTGSSPAGCAFDPRTGDLLAVMPPTSLVYRWRADGTLLNTTRMQGQGAYHLQSLLVTGAGWLAITDWSGSPGQYRVCVMDAAGNSSDCVEDMAPLQMGLTRNAADRITAINLSRDRFLTYAPIGPSAFSAEEPLLSSGRLRSTTLMAQRLRG